MNRFFVSGDWSPFFLLKRLNKLVGAPRKIPEIPRGGSPANLPECSEQREFGRSMEHPVGFSVSLHFTQSPLKNTVIYFWGTRGENV